MWFMTMICFFIAFMGYKITVFILLFILFSFDLKSNFRCINGTFITKYLSNFLLFIFVFTFLYE